MTLAIEDNKPASEFPVAFDSRFLYEPTALETPSDKMERPEGT